MIQVIVFCDFFFIYDDLRQLFNSSHSLSLNFNMILPYSTTVATIGLLLMEKQNFKSPSCVDCITTFIGIDFITNKQVFTTIVSSCSPLFFFTSAETYASRLNLLGTIIPRQMSLAKTR